MDSQPALEVKGSFSVKDIRSLIHEVVIVLGLLGFGTHSYYTSTNFSAVQKELAICQTRLDKLEKAYNLPPDLSGQASHKTRAAVIAPDYTRLIK